MLVVNQILSFLLLAGGNLVDLATKLIGLQNGADNASLSMPPLSPDLITSLPDLPFPFKSRHYSGYLSSLNSTRLFYWFAESQSNPQADPLLLWLSGGPGCSSLFAAFGELGPIRMATNGKLISNPYAWNREANILWIESPAGTGFSYRTNFTGPYQTNDNETALINYHALQSFYQKFPQFRNSPLFIAGQSYAAHYVLQLSEQILKQKAIEPSLLKGVFIGNGAYHANVNQHFTKDFMKAKGFQNYSDEQSPVFNRPLWAYGLNRECYDASKGYDPYIYVPETRSTVPPPSTEPCLSNEPTTRYLNRADVRQAFHVEGSFASPSNFSWTLCSWAKEKYLHYDYNYESMEEHLKVLLQQGNLPVVLYNGDADYLEHYIGAKIFVRKILKLKPVVGKAEKLKHETGVVFGTLRRYEGNLSLAVFYNASHMVPIDEPKGVLQLLTEELFKHKFT